MNTSYELSKFFGLADVDAKTKVLLYICEHDESVLLRAVNTALKPRWEDEVELLLRAQKKITAIKVCRAATGWSLKEAKDAVEGIQREMGL